MNEFLKAIEDHIPAVMIIGIIVIYIVEEIKNKQWKK